MKMSNKIGIIILTVCLMLVASACGGATNNKTPNNSTTPSTPNTPSAPAGQPKQGGSLVVAVQDDPKVLNPLYAGDRVTLTINQSLYAPFYNIDNGKTTYVLAESFTPSADNLKYTMKLREGLTWHDGKPLTADDVVFTMDSILDEKQHSFFRSSFVYDGKPLKTKKIDERTVEFDLPSVSAAFQGMLVQIFPIPKHVFEGETDLEKSAKNASPVGSGPFKFKEYRPGEYVTLERFDPYFNGAAKLDSVTYRVAKDPNAANLALQNGEIQMRMVDTQDYNSLNNTGKFNMVTYLEGRLAYMVFNLNIPALQKKEVRQAIAYALNKDELITAAFTAKEFADAAPSILTPDTLYHTDDVEKYDYNLDTAKSLLKKAGVSSLKVRLAYPNNNKPYTSMALYVQQKLKDIGVDVQLLPMDITAFGNKTLDMNNKDFDLSFGGYIMGAEPDAYRTLFVSSEPYNYSHYKNADFDKLWSDGAVQTDAAKRADIYKKIQQTVASEMTVYPIAYTKAVVAIDKRYGGIQEAVTKPVVILEDMSKVYMTE